MSEDQRPPDDPESTRPDSGDLRSGSDDTTRQGGERPDDGFPVTRLGDFELLRELGRGGMGIVYEARQISLKRRVALKVLPPAIGLTQQARRRFEREAQAAAKLHHTNIVPVHAIGEHDGHHFYAMDLIEGQSLDHVLRDMLDDGSNPLMEATVTQTMTELRPQRAPTAPQDQAAPSLSDTSAGGREWSDTVAKLIADVADALHYAHGRGVIHRDVKPANLMLSRDGHLSLTDFGAESTSSLASLRPRPVAARTALMTAIFLSPTALRTTSNVSFTGAASSPPASAGPATITAPPAAGSMPCSSFRQSTAVWASFTLRLTIFSQSSLISSENSVGAAASVSDILLSFRITYTSV